MFGFQCGPTGDLRETPDWTVTVLLVVVLDGSTVLIIKDQEKLG